MMKSSIVAILLSTPLFASAFVSKKIPDLVNDNRIWKFKGGKSDELESGLNPALFQTSFDGWLGRAPGAHNSDNIRFEGGDLIIDTKVDPTFDYPSSGDCTCQYEDFTTGVFKSIFNVAKGQMVQAKVLFPFQAIVGSIFLQGASSEIGVAEGMFKSTSNASASTLNTASSYCFDSTGTTYSESVTQVMQDTNWGSYNTWAVYYGETHFELYLNGVEFQRFPVQECHEGRMALVFSTEVDAGKGLPPLTMPTKSMRIKYVRTYQLLSEGPTTTLSPTVGPSASPTTASPTLAPTTSAPTTSTPTASPITSTPTASPITGGDCVASHVDQFTVFEGQRFNVPLTEGTIDRQIILRSADECMQFCADYVHPTDPKLLCRAAEYKPDNRRCFLFNDLATDANTKANPKWILLRRDRICKTFEKITDGCGTEPLTRFTSFQTTGMFKFLPYAKADAQRLPTSESCAEKCLDEGFTNGVANCVAYEWHKVKLWCQTHATLPTQWVAQGRSRAFIRNQFKCDGASSEALVGRGPSKASESEPSTVDFSTVQIAFVVAAIAVVAIGATVFAVKRSTKRIDDTVNDAFDYNADDIDDIPSDKESDDDIDHTISQE